MANSTLPDALNNFTHLFSSQTFKHTASVNHNGVLIAFAMDGNGRIYFSVLDSERKDASAIDAQNWTEPRLLQFPEEIVEAGFGVVPPVRLPAVTMLTDGNESLTYNKENYKELSEAELQKVTKSDYWSSTARLTSAVPFQVLTDQKYVYLFRQSIAATNASMLFFQADGTASTNAASFPTDVQGNKKKTALVHSSLLVDRFVLTRKQPAGAGANQNVPMILNLERKLEVRYRRSGNKTRPQSAKDSLGTTDMDDNPFYEPTSELKFVGNLRGGQFAVLRFQTATAGLFRWQIFTVGKYHSIDGDTITDALFSYNVECGADGLFNTQGTTLYTSPDPNYRKTVLERQPGKCPFTNQPLIPVPGESGTELQTFCASVFISNPKDIKNSFAQALSSPLASTLFFQQEPAVTPAQADAPEPLKKPLKRAARVMLALVTDQKHLVTIDFPLSGKGVIPCRAEWDMLFGKALPVPTFGQPLELIAQDAATTTGSMITYAGLLAANASSTTAPELFESAKGRVALYYQNADDQRISVIEYDPTVAKAQFALPTRYDLQVGKLAAGIPAGALVSALQLEKAPGPEVTGGAVLKIGTEQFFVPVKPTSALVTVKPIEVTNSLSKGSVVNLALGAPSVFTVIGTEDPKATFNLQARTAGTWANEATIRISGSEGDADFCDVKLQCGTVTETFKRVPRELQRFADVLNGNINAHGKTYIGTGWVDVSDFNTLHLEDLKATLLPGDSLQLGFKTNVTVGREFSPVRGSGAQAISIAALSTGPVLAAADTYVYREKEYIGRFANEGWQIDTFANELTLPPISREDGNAVLLQYGDRIYIEGDRNYDPSESSNAHTVFRFTVMGDQLNPDNQIAINIQEATFVKAGTRVHAGDWGLGDKETYIGELERAWDPSAPELRLLKSSLTVLRRDLLTATDSPVWACGPWDFTVDLSGLREENSYIVVPITKASLGGAYRIYRLCPAPLIVGKLAQDWVVNANRKLSFNKLVETVQLNKFDRLLVGSYRILVDAFIPADKQKKTAAQLSYNQFRSDVINFPNFHFPVFLPDYDYATQATAGQTLSNLFTVLPGAAEGQVQNAFLSNKKGGKEPRGYTPITQTLKGAISRWVSGAVGHENFAVRFDSPYSSALATTNVSAFTSENDLTVELWANPVVPALNFVDDNGFEIDRKPKNSKGVVDPCFTKTAFAAGFTIEMWAYVPSSMKGENCILFWGDNPRYTSGVFDKHPCLVITHLNSDGDKVKHCLRIYSNSYSETTDQPLPVDKWFHLALTVAAAGTTALYIDGKQSNIAKTRGDDLIKNNTLSLWLGRIGPSVGGREAGKDFVSFKGGRIRDFFISDAVLSQNQLKENLTKFIPERSVFKLMPYIKQAQPATPQAAHPLVMLTNKDLNAVYSLGLEPSANNDGRLNLLSQVGQVKIQAPLTATLLPANDDNWMHLAAVFKQPYAVQLDGKADSYLDAGNDRSLDAAGDFTIDIQFQLDKKAKGAQALLSKGTLSNNEHVPYAVYLNSELRPVFSCEDQDGNLFTCGAFKTVRTGTPVRLTISRQRRSFSVLKGKGADRAVESTSDFYDVRFYIDGQDAGQPPLLPLKQPESNVEPDGTYKNWVRFVLQDGAPLTISACTYLLPDPVLKATDDNAKLAELDRCYKRRWYLKLKDEEKRKDFTDNTRPVYLGRADGNENPGNLRGALGEVRLWNRALSEAEVAEPAKAEKGLISRWQMDARKGHFAYDSEGENHARLRGASWVKSPFSSRTFALYRNGTLLSSATTTTDLLTAKQNVFQVGGHSVYGVDLDELRIWNVPRTEQELQESLFSPLRGTQKNLIAHYTFNTYDMGTKSCADNSGKGITLEAQAQDSVAPLKVASDAPIGEDIPLVVARRKNDAWQRNMDTAPSVQEYATLELAADGTLSGTSKRCYSFIRDQQWLLVTGYTVGRVVAEWLGQVQSNPQVIGYIEGAPPVPGENLTNPNKNSTRPKDYVGNSAVEFGSNSIGKFIYTASNESGFDMDLDAKLGIGPSAKVDAGLGVETEVAKVKATVGPHFRSTLAQSQAQKNIYTRGYNQAEKLRVELSGYWEVNESAAYLNAAVGRRFIPANTGVALVESETMDMYALRLEHNHALVAYRLRPNFDIPRDRNLLVFPINPQYTKQGTLDGKVGCKDDGSVQCDPDYPMATGYGEYSYYKPKEAYRIKKKIDREKVELQTYYDQQYISSKNPGIPTVPGLHDLATRNLADTYIWTAEHGFYAATISTMEAAHEASTGRYYFKGIGGLNLSMEYAAGVAVKFDLDWLFGGHVERIRMKEKDDEQDFGLTIDVKGESDLQLYANTSAEIAKHGRRNELDGAFDDQGRPVLRPGKVDAYRFMTFWLAPSKENFEDLTKKVIDPTWLSQSNSANAAALRQATQSSGGCWCIFHRVTFVSRIHSQFESAGALQAAARKLDIKSNWELIKAISAAADADKLHGDFASFSSAIRNAIAADLPELIPHTEEIIEFMSDYYMVYDE